MNPECVPFRTALERALSGPSAAFFELARDPHLAACAVCRAELAREERLECALTQVPAPETPRGLAQRMLSGLAAARAAEAFGAESSEPGALEPDELDELLARVPAPRTPPGLAAGVLAGLAPARRKPRARRRWFLAAAAAVLAASLFWWRSGAPTPAEPGAVVVNPELESDEDLLAYAVENLDLLQDDDLDVWLASLDPVDEFLMRIDDDPTWLDEPAAAKKAGD
jgi:hypothetical protein